MKESSPLFYSSLISGLVTSFFLILYPLVFYIFHISEYNIFLILLNKFFPLIILILGMYLGIKYYRNRFCGGYIKYKESFLSGLMIGVNASILISLFMYVLYKFIAPELLTESIERSVEYVKSLNIYSDSRIQQEYDTMSRFTPEMVLLTSLLELAFLSAIVSLIISVFTKKDKPIFDSNSSNENI